MKNNHFLFIAADKDPATVLDGWYIAAIDGRQATTLAAFYDQMAEALDFPDYFGYNLDSLDELLNDLQWITQEKIIIYIKNSAEWLTREKSSDKVLTLIDLLEATAEDWEWLDEDSDLARKELGVLFDESPRIRTLLEDLEIPVSEV